MTESRPNFTERSQAEADARRMREAEALRENLRRRKAQSRQREDERSKHSPPLEPSADV